MALTKCALQYGLSNHLNRHTYIIEEIVEEAQAFWSVISTQYTSTLSCQKMLRCNGQGNCQSTSNVAGRHCWTKPIWGCYQICNLCAHLQTTAAN